MNSSPFKLLRQKFVEDLEEILECPICLDGLTRSVVQCQKGHNICSKCFIRLLEKKCPLCKHSYHGTRNFLAQNLVTKFEEIKTSLIDPTHSINESIVKDKMSIGTQTSPPRYETNLDDVFITSYQSSWINADDGKGRITRLSIRKNDIQNRNKKNDNETPVQIQECNDFIEGTANDTKIVNPENTKIPCQIGNCKELLSHHLMICHVKNYHAEYFIDAGKVRGNIYMNHWKIHYKPNRIFDQAIYIDNVGMFFIKVIISREGDVHGYVHLNNIAKKDKHFRCSLNIGKNGNFISYKGKVLDSRVLLQNNPKGLFISSRSMKNLNRKSRSFECILKIKPDKF